MILVIMVHVSNIYSRNYIELDFNYFITTFFNAISRYSVLFFFMISGLLIIPKEDDFEKYLNRIKKIIIPLFIFSIFYLLFDFILFGRGINFHSLSRLLFSPVKAHMWFLYAILGIYIVLPFIRKISLNMSIKEENLFIFLWLFFEGFVYLIRLILGYSISYPIPMIQGVYYMGYFMVGHIIFKRLREINLKKIIIISIISSIIIILGTYILTGINGKYFEGLFAYRNLFYMISGIGFFASILKMDENKFESIKKYILNISNHTYFIYLIHVVYLNILFEIIKVHEFFTFTLFSIPFFTFVIFVLSYLTSYLLKKLPIVDKYI